ncbi:MAG TPA: glycosyltransferase family 4 protein, partial [Actinomycetota bacterium]|nr:glycosyltransferase family 4 protein [Actinomycetota bacterium]
LRLCRQFKPAALLAHMSPVYLIHAYPLARVFGISLALWFVHPSRSKSLVLAESFGDTILTALPGSYPGDSPKLRPIGHGIDVTALQQIPPQLNGDILELVSLGRTSPVKDYPTALRGLALLTQSGLRVRFSIFGDSITPIEARHRKELVKVAEGLGVREFFRLLDGVPHSEIGNVLGGADLLLNGNAGGADKVIFEAMAAGKPVVTSNRQFGHMMPNPEALLFEPGDPVSLASKIERFAAMSPPERAHLGATLRLRVIKEHSLERWADKVVAALSE